MSIILMLTFVNLSFLCLGKNSWSADVIRRITQNKELASSITHNRSVKRAYIHNNPITLHFIRNPQSFNPITTKPRNILTNNLITSHLLSIDCLFPIKTYDRLH